MKEIFQLTLSLTLICAIAGAALSYVSQTTADRREISRLRQRSAKMALLLPTETFDTPSIHTSSLEDGSTVEFFAAKDTDGKTLAFCAQGSDASGFGGEVKLLVGLELDGTIRGILVSENSETPGIGSRVVSRSVRRSLWDVLAGRKAETAALPPNAYLDSYDGQQLSHQAFAFGEEAAPYVIQPVSGATISSGAVLRAVNRIREAWTNLPSSVKEM